ncbi:hypothetical protein AB4113_13635 [Vibrio breoganii]
MMKDSIIGRWEIGSEFCDSPPFFGRVVNWPGDKKYFLSSGRTPVILLKEKLKGKTLYCPNYYCLDVLNYWISHGINLSFYDVKFENGYFKVKLDSIKPNSAILAVNYFGSENGLFWRSFQDRNDFLLIEDHTHDPVSSWALSSKADYAFSSLRKTLPITDGCIFWSPNGSKLPPAPSSSFDSELKRQAMSLKQKYLNDQPVDKSKFLKLYELAEDMLIKSEPQLISDNSKHSFPVGYPEDFLIKKRSNYSTLLSALDVDIWSVIELVDMCKESTPFGFVFKCKTNQKRNDLRQHLTANNIYCPIHWSQDLSFSGRENFELGNRILTVPIDHRYNSSDILKVAATINRFFHD